MKQLGLTLLLLAVPYATAQTKEYKCDGVLSRGAGVRPLLESVTSGTYFETADAKPVLITGGKGSGKTFQLYKLQRHLTAQKIPHIIVERVMLGEPSFYSLPDTREIREATEDHVRFIIPPGGDRRVKRAHTHPRVQRQAYLDGLMLEQIEQLGRTPGLFVLVDLFAMGPGNSPYRTAETLENLIALRERFKFKMLVTQSTAELDSVRAELSDRAVERVLSSYQVINLRGDHAFAPTPPWWPSSDRR